MKHLYLVRGLPGSGKSTFARARVEMVNRGYLWAKPARHYETDMYFGEGANYKFDATKLEEAHSWCQQQVLDALHPDYQIDEVWVSNTFSQKWEMAIYLKMAQEAGAKVTIIKMEGNYGSLHAPQEVIDRMKKRWEEV